MNRLLILCLLPLALAACGKSTKTEMAASSSRGGADMAAPAPPPPSAPGQAKEAPKLAYSHSLALEMTADKVAPRFERARKACLDDASMGCILVHASIAAGDEESGRAPSAQITVRVLPAKIAAYQAGLLAPFEGEAKGDPIVRRSSTDAEDLTFVIQDAERRMAQLVDYRDRLIALAKRSDAKTEDLIRIHEKIAEVQSQIEALQAEQRGLYLRVETELLSVSLEAKASIGSVRSPLAEAWRNAGRELGESAASAFTFFVTMLPWIPVIAIGLWILAWIVRVVRRRRAQGAH